MSSPAADLPRVDIHELELLGVNLVDAVDSRVIQYVRARPCPGQRLDVRAGVVQGTVDHAGDEGHLTDRLPVHRIGMRHGWDPPGQAMTGSDAASARRRGDWK